MGKFSWKITGKKFMWSAAEIIVLGMIAYAAEEPLVMAILPFLEAAKNWLKHRKD